MLVIAWPAGAALDYAGDLSDFRCVSLSRVPDLFLSPLPFTFSGFRQYPATWVALCSIFYSKIMFLPPISPKKYRRGGGVKSLERLF